MLLSLVLHITIGRFIGIGGYVFCYVYLGAILFLPIGASPLLVLIGSFFVGLLNDFFYDSAGLHAGATVFLAFMRAQVLRIIRPSGGYMDYMEPTGNSMGYGWFIYYAGSLVFMHHLFLFLAAYARWDAMGLALIKAVASSLLTLLALLLLQFSLELRQGKGA